MGSGRRRSGLPRGGARGGRAHGGNDTSDKAERPRRARVTANEALSAKARQERVLRSEQAGQSRVNQPYIQTAQPDNQG